MLDVLTYHGCGEKRQKADKTEKDSKRGGAKVAIVSVFENWRPLLTKFYSVPIVCYWISKGHHKGHSKGHF